MKMIATIAAAVVSLGTVAQAADLQPLVDPAGLAALDDVTVIDIRDPKAFATAHIPGAVNAPYPAWRGPATNPGEPMTDAAVTALFQAIGLTPDSRVVVAHAGVNQTDFGAAARVYWTLKSAGLGELAILNGGVRSWIEDGEPLSVTATAPTPSTATFTLSDEWAVDAADVADIIDGKRAGTLVDARPPAFFAAELKHPAASAPGTLATAKNAPFAAWFDGDDTEIAGDATAKTVAAAIDGVGDGDTVSFCNTGHWAATNWFALSELAGKDNVKLYPESMVGWLADGGSVVKGE